MHCVGLWLVIIIIHSYDTAYKVELPLFPI